MAKPFARPWAGSLGIALQSKRDSASFLRVKDPRVFLKGLASLGLLALSACSWVKDKPQVNATARALRVDAPSPSRPSSAPSSELQGPEPAKTPTIPAAAMILDEPETLRALEYSGFSFSRLAFGAPTKTAEYRSWVHQIESEILASQGWDKRAGVGMRFAHRRFDVDWLRSPEARLELVGVVNRYDRMPFAPEHCGELRLVYRLAYETERSGLKVASRLPMTVNLVLWQARPPSGRCQDTWKHWVSAQGPALGQLVNLGKPAIKSLEVNLQSIRWPATVHPSLGGYAEYLLMQFRPVPSGGYRAAALENQPKYKSWSRKAQSAFRKWLAQPEQIAALNQGTLVLPERDLAKVAISAAPHGLARGINRPYARLMPPELYKDFPFEKLGQISNPEELERRLDTMSCSGCHQSKSLAGFHLLGQDAPNKSVDALAVPYSPHLLDELEIRRQGFAAALKSGQSMRPRENPQRSYQHDPGGWGDHCSIGKIHSDWGCKPGLDCEATADPSLGHCQSQGDAQVGESCEVGSIARNLRPSDERARAFVYRNCQAGVCERTRVGFPGGMCAMSCEPASPDKRCGSIALLTNFNQCLAQRKPFAHCIVENSRPAGLRRCEKKRPCRDDMICARVERSEVGACIPPYFLFQLRVDGHPKP